MLSSDRLRELLDYDPATGVFRWRGRRQGVNSDMIAGIIHGAWGYRVIRIDGRLYRANRLAWLWMTGYWPERDVDHRNGDRADDRWDNLREATQTQNNGNARRRSDNSSGFKGVTKRAKRFAAAICASGDRRHLGYFDTAEQAHAAYCAAATALFGEFARAE